MTKHREKQLRRQTRQQILAHLAEAARGDNELLMKEVYEDANDEPELAVVDSEVKAMLTWLRRMPRP